MASTIAFNTNINDNDICRSNKDSSEGAEKAEAPTKTTHKGGRASRYVPMNRRKRGKGRSAFAK
ncbi:MAG TPA: hypothetical protein VFJ51_14090 [Nitrososphaeraceae archaeon]|nr:hypothetical protein [Nitrososphaeraceae archaeon]